MQPTFTVDEREFGKTIREYIDATGKDAAYCANRQGLNVAIKTARGTPLADKSKIREVVNQTWWPKYVAKNISGSRGGITITQRGGKKRKVQGHYTVKDARAVSIRLIRKKLRRAGFIRSGWNPSIVGLAALKLKTAPALPAGTRNIKNPKGSFVAAKPGINPVCTIINDSQGAEKVGAAALQNGIALATADMRGFIAERFGETAKKFNAH